MISDTTSVNYGKKNRVVDQLQRIFLEKNISKRQIISCQHHILDRIFCLVMDEEFVGSTESPNIEYPFVSELLNDYDVLNAKFVDGTEKIVINQAGEIT